MLAVETCHKRAEKPLHVIQYDLVPSLRVVKTKILNTLNCANISCSYSGMYSMRFGFECRRRYTVIKLTGIQTEDRSRDKTCIRRIATNVHAGYFDAVCGGKSGMSSHKV